MNTAKPKVAVIDPNTLAAIGLQQLLQKVIPFMTVDTFSSFAELEANHPEHYAHYFTAMNIVLQNRPFFTENRRKTIVLTSSPDNANLLSEFHCLCVNMPEPTLVRSLLMLHQHAHSGGKNLPPMPQDTKRGILSEREIQVMNLIVRGYINKQIADQLNIGLATVVTHRRNIMEKLGIKSVSALTIYAVMHGYVDINKI